MAFLSLCLCLMPEDVLNRLQAQIRVYKCSQIALLVLLLLHLMQLLPCLQACTDLLLMHAASLAGMSKPCHPFLHCIWPKPRFLAFSAFCLSMAHDICQQTSKWQLCLSCHAAGLLTSVMSLTGSVVAIARNSHAACPPSTCIKQYLPFAW